MTIDFNKYVKEGNFLDLPKTAIFKGSCFGETELHEINANIANNPGSYKINLAELVDFIKSNTNITRVSLPYCDRIDENNMSFVDLLKNSNITKLNIAANGLGDTAANDSTNIIKSIAEALKNNKTLTILDLSSNFIGDEGAKAIAEALKKNKTLTSLNLSSNFIGAEGTKAIVEALLVYNSTLASLNLSLNNIKDGAVELIAKMLESNRTLTNFDLSHNRITVEGIKAIVESLKNNKTLTNLELSYNCIGAEGIKAIAEMLESNTTLVNINLKEYVLIDDTVIENINKKLQRNKEIKDISEAFKPIISEITLDTDGTPLLSLDKEDSEQNSCLNKLKGYSEKYGELLLPALEQSIAQSLYQDTVHVHKDGIEQLSFTARSKPLTEIMQTVLEHLGFKEDKINEFNSKIVEIIREVEEMFLVELDILNNNLMNTDEIDVQTNTFDLKKPLEFLCYHEFIVGEGLKPSFDSDINVESLNDQQKVELKNNQQLTDLYEKHPELKMPGTILRDFLKSDSTIYLNTARELKQHTDEQTFKHNLQIQKLLNEFTIELNNISAIELQESSLAPKQKVSLEAPLAQHSDSHLPNISEHTSIGLATDDPITPVLGDSSHHID
ncbi:hypothetical protein [Candidatus Tisiphia endosymbiont of Xenochironomus xenolabis]|uniref:hypothetical protein n=1 Tax=unclassified Candidatus Tisiphia TaxID=2996318 RepID=UPI0035C8A8A3